MLLRPQDSFPVESWMEYAGELEKQIKDLRKKKTYSHLLDQCNQQAKQIAALKSALVDRHLNMAEWIKECGYEYSSQMMQEKFFTNADIGCAVRQLARELPMIDWSDVE